MDKIKFSMSNEEIRRNQEQKEYNKTKAVNACKAILGLVVFVASLATPLIAPAASFGPASFGALGGGLFFSYYSIKKMLIAEEKHKQFIKDSILREIEEKQKENEEIKGKKL